MADGGPVGSTASDCGFWCLVTSCRFAEAVSSLAKPKEVVLRPKEEQDLVGFGWREILGLKEKSSGNAELAAETHQVYYVTNRVCEREDEKMGKVYGKHMDSGLHVGVVDVDCPNGKPQVKAEGQLVTSMDAEAFKQRLREHVARDENKAVLVYVHGCFTDFSRGMGYGAFMQRGLDFSGPMVVYSWPTVGRPSVSVGLGVISLYRQDEVTCMQAAPDLRDLLQMLSQEVGAKAVHVMAYSMGARTLLEALRLSSVSPPHLDPFHARTGVTSHIYFMAPDVAAHSFSSVIRKFKFPGIAWDGESEGKNEISRGVAWEGEAGEREMSAGCALEAGAEEEETGCGVLDVSPPLTFLQQASAPASAPSSPPASAPSLAPSPAPPPAPSSAAASAPSSAPSSTPSSTYDLEARSHDSMIERIADVWNVAGENTSGWVTLRQAWQEVREKGLMEVWNEIFHLPGLEEPGGHASAEAVLRPVGARPERFGGASETVFRTREAGGAGEHSSLQPAVRENAHIHLFTARNDIALLLSEFMDAGIPKVRAGRGSDDFLLCCGHKAFDTVDVSSLNSGLLSTGHFYLFHHIEKRPAVHHCKPQPFV
ncbi:unnamed protein product [Closterium sp. Yama58-4]|nr:unnamed protein product [Closterium sp. Yama58-4]